MISVNIQQLPISMRLTATAPLNRETLTSSLAQISFAVQQGARPEVLGKIHALLLPHQQSWIQKDEVAKNARTDGSQKKKKRMPKQAILYFEALASEDKNAISQALTSINTHRKAFELLLQNQELVKEIRDVALSHPIDSSKIAEQVQAWRNLPIEEPMPGPTGLTKFWGDAKYWTGNLSFPATLTFTAIDLVVQAVELITTGQVGLAMLLLNMVFVAGNGIALQQRKSRIMELLLSMNEGQLTTTQVQQFFDFVSQIDPAGTGEKIGTLESIRKSSGPGHAPTLSKAATWKIVADFIHLMAVATKHFQRNLKGPLYDGIAQFFGIGVLQRLQWNPLVLHHDRLGELLDLQRSGAILVFYGNHSSHLDILADLSLASLFRLRMVAKQELGNTPILGINPLHHFLSAIKTLSLQTWRDDSVLGAAGHPVINRGGGEEAVSALIQSALKIVEDDNSLFIYPEGTRQNTPNRTEEVFIGSFKTGLAKILQAIRDRYPERKLLAVGIGHYGLGITLPASVKKSVQEGAMLHSDIALSLNEPLEITKEDSDAEALNHRLLAQMQKHLLPIQAYMNNGLHRTP